MIYSTETVLGIADVLAADAAGNKQATMTDIDCAVNMLRSLAGERDNLKGLAEHRGRSIDNLLNIQGKQSTEIERLQQQRDQLLAALENAHKLILSFREEEVSYFDKGTGFYDHEKELAAHDAEYNAAIAATKGGAA